MRRAICAGLTAAGACGALALGLASTAPAAGSKPKPKRVEVYDNYYAPAKLTVRPGTKVTWVWPADVGDNHDVKTKTIPKGARKFRSPPYAAGPARWSQTFKRSGRYKLYCTFHETEMTMTITVKKK